MPIYEYKCSACQHEMESLQKFSDAPLVTCPACGKDALTKLVSAAGFQLKGSGWYQTDFRGSGAKPAAKPEGATGEASKDSASADGGKPAAATPDTKSSDSKSSESKSTAAATTTSAAPAAGTPSAGA